MDVTLKMALLFPSTISAAHALGFQTAPKCQKHPKAARFDSSQVSKSKNIGAGICIILYRRLPVFSSRQTTMRLARVSIRLARVEEVARLLERFESICLPIAILSFDYHHDRRICSVLDFANWYNTHFNRIVALARQLSYVNLIDAFSNS